jgi:cobalamin biosynthesis Co2+ chelatase CbiK
MSKKSKPIVVVVADDMLPNIKQVADRLAAEGMKVERVMPMTGVISGSYESTDMSSLEKVNGVMSVEEEATAHLLPPDSSLQ